MLFRNRLPLLYSIFGLISSVFIIIIIISNEESKSFNSFFIISLLAYFSFWGVYLFCWYWGRNLYVFFIVKKQLGSIIFSKVITVYLINFIFILTCSFIFYFLEYYYYLKILSLSAINSLGFFSLLWLYLLSKGRGTVDLFDNKVFILKNNLMNYLSFFLIAVYLYTNYLLFEKTSFKVVLCVVLILNIALLFSFSHKVLRRIESELMKIKK